MGSDDTYVQQAVLDSGGGFSWAPKFGIGVYNGYT